jgi:lysozyme
MFMSQPARLVMRNTEKKVMKYYNDGNKGRGNCTWGIGTKAHNGPCTKVELARVVTDPDVEKEFSKRLNVAEKAIQRSVTADLTQDQFDALVSFTYNVGEGAASNVYDMLNDGDFDGAAAAILSRVYGHERQNGKRVTVFYRGLVPRRELEAAPFKNTKSRSAAK